MRHTASLKQFVFLPIILIAATLSAQDLLKPDSWDDYYDFACLEKLVEKNYYDFYMCRPSFTKEYALSFFNQEKTLILKKAQENIWYHDSYYISNGERLKHDKHGGYHNVEVVTHKLDVKPEAVTLIFEMVKAANESATYFNGQSSGCDGVSYYFHTRDKYGSVWVPKKESRTGRLVAVMDSICRAVEIGDTSMVYRQMPTCHTLLVEFRNDYPLSAFKPSITCYYAGVGIRNNREYKFLKVAINQEDTTTAVCIRTIRGRQLDITYTFQKPTTSKKAKEWAATLEKTVALMSRKMFLSQDLQNMDLDVRIDEEQREDYYYREDGKTTRYFRLSDTTDFENRCLSAPLTEEGLFRRQVDGTWQKVDTVGTIDWRKDLIP